MYYNGKYSMVFSEWQRLNEFKRLKRRDLISDNERGVIWRQVDIVSRDKARFRCKDKPLIRRYVRTFLSLVVRVTRVLYLHTCTHDLRISSGTTIHRTYRFQFIPSLGKRFTRFALSSRLFAWAQLRVCVCVYIRMSC